MEIEVKIFGMLANFSLEVDSFKIIAKELENHSNQKPFVKKASKVIYVLIQKVKRK